MSWSETTIARALCTQFLNRRCVVLVDNCNWTGHECDVLAVTLDLRVIDIEIKISRADLKADAAKSKWWHHLSYSDAKARGLDVKNWDPYDHRERREWPRKVWKHYYCMPAAIWTDDLLPLLGSTASGVLLIREQRPGGATLSIECARRARPNKDAERVTPEQAVDVARLANLRMWEAYAARDQAREDGRRQLAMASAGVNA